MGEVDLTNFPGLIEAVKTHGGLNGIVRFYDIKTGEIYKAVAVYPANGPGYNGTCIDIERVPLGEPD